VLNVALTGNVASGKSTVARWFAEWGATVIDADAIVREVQQPGSPVVKAIRDRFGDAVIQPDGSLNRDVLRRRVMAHANARSALNAIVHPAVQRRRTTLIEEARARGDRVVVSDIPLLFEVLDPSAFDAVVLVDAPVPIRRDRLIRDRGLSAQEADDLIAAQLPSATKRARSDIVIENADTLDILLKRARHAWSALLDLASGPG